MMNKDWDKSYTEGDAPWDTGFPSSELKKVIKSGIVKLCRALDIGCGTGTNAIYLAQKGFDVTALDVSDIAIKMAMEKVKTVGVKVDFIKTTLPDLNIKGGPFDFIFDRGCFHTIKDSDRTIFVEMLIKLTTEGSVYLMLCGNAKEPREDGPPTLREDEIRDVFSAFFDFIWLEDFRFDANKEQKPGPLGYSCLMKRKNQIIENDKK
ncbi:MAG: methyltransferase domain-containing protein [Deltaproteobacteria bacterium]|nr:methyltransferase domain-containing protein [Deltaproteobacteria bacterium]